MASVTLVASGTTGQTGMSISGSYPITNAYDNSSDTSNYARCSISTSATGYVYLTYDTSNIPTTATIESVVAKARLRISNTSRVINRVCQLYTGTTAKGSNTDFSSTSSGGTVINLSTGTWTRSELNDLRMRIGGTGSSSTSSRYIYIYGTDITITYTAESRTVTTTLTGNGTINPSGTQTMYDGDEYELMIEPTNASDTVTATKNGTAITLTQHAGGAQSESNVLGKYTLVSGSLNGSGVSYFQGLVGKGYDNTQTTSNYYSGGNGTIAVFTYDVPFEEIPENATINSLYMRVNGHAESTSQSSEYMCVRLISGSTNLSDELNFKSVGTSNTTQTVTANVTPTIAQLENLKVQCRLGYYGGAINGATVYLEYEVAGVYYTYSTTINGNMTIAVTIGSSSNIPVTGVSLPSTATVEVGSSITLTPTISPTNATNQNVTGSSGNTARATVNNGVVTGVSAGTVVITVITVDGNKTASCTVTVATAVTYDYKLATSTVVGKKYLIANGNTGTVHLLTNESGGSRQLVGMSVTVSNGRISLTSAQKAKAEFECVRYTANNDNTITMKSDDKYIYTDNSTGLKMNAPTTLDRFWHYRDNKFWQFKSTTADGYEDTSTEYKYYLEMTGSNFTDNHVTSPSISDTDIPAIYIFVEDDGTTEQIYAKVNGTGTQFSKVHKKVNGSGVEQSSSTGSTLFNTNTNYRKMN